LQGTFRSDCDHATMRIRAVNISLSISLSSLYFTIVYCIRLYPRPDLAVSQLWRLHAMGLCLLLSCILQWTVLILVIVAM